MSSVFPEVPTLNREPRNGELVGGDGSNLNVRFYLNPSDDKDHIEIMIPGDKHHRPDFIADEHYQRKYMREWKIYKGELSEFHGQTRLETVAWIDPGNVREMKHLNCHTVEQLAGMSDGTLSTAGMMGPAQIPGEGHQAPCRASEDQRV